MSNRFKKQKKEKTISPEEMMHYINTTGNAGVTHEHPEWSERAPKSLVEKGASGVDTNGDDGIMDYDADKERTIVRNQGREDKLNARKNPQP